MPASFIIARTSAKSTFMWPGFVIMSEIPFIACFKISFDLANASSIEIFGSEISRSRWFGTTIKVSTDARSCSIVSSAYFNLRLPSNKNGFVTTTTVKIPSSLAALAITGRAPVPVPPPSPAVRKRISVY